MAKHVRTNNLLAWERTYEEPYSSGGTFLPAWGVHASGSELTSKLLRIKDLAVLEIGCGIGESVPYVKKQKPAAYVGMDISRNAIAKAKTRHASDTVSFRVADMAKTFPFPDRSFDEVFSVYGLGWSQDVSKTLAEAFRVLKPSGTFTFSWDHHLIRVTDECDGRVSFQNSYHREAPTIRYNWNQTGYNIHSFQAKPSTWFALLRKAGFEVTAFHEVDASACAEQKHVFSRTYSKSKAASVPFALVMQGKKPYE